jgi:hypothetical protein
MFHNCNKNSKNSLQPVYIIEANVKKQIAHVLEKNKMQMLFILTVRMVHMKNKF